MTYPTNDKTGAENLVSFVLAVRTKCQTLLDNQGSLTSLTTEDKASLVVAINELVTSINTIKAEIASKSEIDDTKTTTTNVWSASKTSTEIATAATNLKNDLLGGAGEAYDTLKELADLIDTNKDAIDALEALAAGHVKFDGEQTLTDSQKAQARTNIGAAASVHTHAIADVAELQDALDAKALQTDLDTLKTSIGATNVDLADIFANGVTE